MLVVMVIAEDLLGDGHRGHGPRPARLYALDGLAVQLVNAAQARNLAGRPVHRLGGQMIHSTRAIAPL